MGAWEDGQKLVAVLRSQASILKVLWRVGIDMRYIAIPPSGAREWSEERERDGDSL